MSLVGSSSADLDLDTLVDNFKKNVSVKDRRYRFKTYKKCFVGSDAVQWMVSSGTAETREDAVTLGLLMQEAGLIEHCVRDHEYVAKVWQSLPRFHSALPFPAAQVVPIAAVD